MATCLVTGTIYNGSEVPVSGTIIYAVPAQSPALSSTGFAVSSNPISTYTSSTGYFELTLIQNMAYVVTIQALGFREKIMIPAATTYNIFNLTSVQAVTGDVPDPAVPADENPAW
jgi:hypothetical protein